jgi:hypothetical protein
MMFTLLMSGAIYPIAASWVLGHGWLDYLGYRDAAGAGYIHMIGGVSGLVGTIILGPRFGIFDTQLQIQKNINMRKRNYQSRWQKRQNGYIEISDDNTYDSDTNVKMEKLNSFENSKINKNSYFYYHDQETPMKQRV